MKPGKKEKIRFGQAPTNTLPAAAETKTGFEDNFYDNTDFNPSPVDPSELADEPNPNDPNF